MQIKRLEIQGFKSFRDKTVIHFDHKITGIVGPNGCGKSNIVDAFFWVMGEQSYKHMRGNTSEDFIFNGSSKSTQLGLAEATLVLAIDSQQGHSQEIAITRRVYRSGEGEYLINNISSRLKDIQELFMDTGVGAKGYSIIEQGQIGKIVHAKPEERRLLIEEAAGIAKYKARKKESLRKMEATELNLERLMDLFKEIEKNLKSLEKQAEKARIYQKYKQELFQKETAWGQRKIEQLKNHQIRLQSQYEQDQQNCLRLQTEIQTQENLVETQKLNQLQWIQTTDTLQQKIQELVTQLTESNSQLDFNLRQENDSHLQQKTLQHEKSQIQNHLLHAESALKELEEQNLQFTQTTEHLQGHIKTQETQRLSLQREKNTTQQTLQTLQKAILALHQQLSTYRAQSTSLLNQATLAQKQAETILQPLEGLRQHILEIHEELILSQNQLQDLEVHRTELHTQHKTAVQSLQTLKKQFFDLEKTKNNALTELTQLKSQLESLEELDQAYQGYTDGTKHALEWLKKHHPHEPSATFMDHLIVEPGYETLLEYWLQHQLEYLLISPKEIAWACLQDLQQQRLGRIGIRFPSRHINVASHPFETLQKDLTQLGFTVIGQLSHFVHYSQKETQFHEDYSQLLNQVCIVSGEEAVWLNLLKNDPEKLLNHWCLMSQDGKILHHCTLQGGQKTSGKIASILKRKQKIQELQEKIPLAQTHYHQLNTTALETQAHIQELTTHCETLDTHHQKLEIQVIQMQHTIQQRIQIEKDSTLQLERIQRQEAELSLQAKKALEDRTLLETRIQTAAQELQEKEAILQNHQSIEKEQEETLRILDHALQSDRIQQASLQEKLQSIHREKRNFTSSAQERTTRLTQINLLFEQSAQDHVQRQAQNHLLKTTIEETTVQLTDQRHQLEQWKHQIDQSQMDSNQASAQTRELRRTLETKQIEMNQINLNLEKFSQEQSFIIRNLEEKYGPDCFTTPISLPEELEETTLQAQLETLKDRIRRLGEINTMAIEEFDTLKIRHTHLLSEKSDLEHSLQDLKKAIQQINDTSEVRFQKTFKAIAERFEKLFPAVFGGGKAELTLLPLGESQELLDSGIDILAQPPGKKITNIGLLSGGEKALTAVCLIFSIFMIKPSPFCILDEVDAPLDDANIGRFNALLKEMSQKSQFILITHNKRTMELNDTLYGVTMEEPGVSKMVSIQLHAS